MPGNLPFTIAQTSNTVRTLRRRYIFIPQWGLLSEQVFPYRLWPLMEPRRNRLWFNPVIKGAEPTDWVECHTQHTGRPQPYAFCPACTFGEMGNQMILCFWILLPKHVKCVSLCLPLHLITPLPQKGWWTRECLREVWLYNQLFNI